jgi:hypothetical protein
MLGMQYLFLQPTYKERKGLSVEHTSKHAEDIRRKENKSIVLGKFAKLFRSCISPNKKLTLKLMQVIVCVLTRLRRNDVQGKKCRLPPIISMRSYSPCCEAFDVKIFSTTWN